MTDPLTRGRLPYRQHGVGIELEVAHGLFSATTIDPGTRFLLRWLGQRGGFDGTSVLDIGCGYGPIGAGRGQPHADRVEAVDRDAVAVEWTTRNAIANGVADRVTTTASLGYDDVAGDRYGLVVSNIPAKVGPAALEHLLFDASPRLAAGGEVAVVVVDGLAPTVRTLLERPGVRIEAEHANRGYLQVTYGFEAGAPGDATPGFERGVYGRATGEFGAAELQWTAATVRTLPEFDTLGHGTTAAIELLAGEPPAGPVTIVGVGQGHLCLALEGLGVRALTLVDRDLLAVRTAAANVAAAAPAAQVDCHHAARPLVAPGSDVIVFALPEKQPVSVTAALLGAALGGVEGDPIVVLHGRSADVSRVAELLPRHGARWVERTRRRCRAHAAAALRRR